LKLLLTWKVLVIFTLTPATNTEQDQDSKIDENEQSPLHWHCLKHGDASSCTSECLFQDVIGLFSKREVLLIIRQLLLHQKLRFNELLEKVGGSPKTLTSRLRELQEYGLLHRELFNEVPIRVEYSLTLPGKDLDDLFERIARWIRKWRCQLDPKINDANQTHITDDSTL
jgi:DNA-binding HxlR family transcriptional regulator